MTVTTLNLIPISENFLKLPAFSTKVFHDKYTFLGRIYEDWSISENPRHHHTINQEVGENTGHK